MAGVDDLVREELDVYSPNALGGALDEVTVTDLLRARVVCGGANNQLVSEGHGGTAERLPGRGITYAPDFLVNAGGVIQVSDELHGFDMERARRHAATIFDHTLEVLRSADAEDVTPAVAADRLAKRRIAAGGRAPGCRRGNIATPEAGCSGRRRRTCSTHVPLAPRHTHHSRDRSATWDDPERRGRPICGAAPAYARGSRHGRGRAKAKQRRSLAS